MKTDSSHSIFQSAAKFFSGTLLSRISGMLRDMSIAYAFGTESALAIFFIAFRFSHLARRLFGEGSMQTAFVPCFEDMRAKDEKKALFFFRDLACLLALVLIGLICLGIGILHTLPLYGENAEIAFLTALMLPSLLFICLYGLNTAYLECEKSFFTPGVAPVAFNAVWIAAAFILMHNSAYDAMKWLSLAVVIGCFAQWAVTVPRTYRLWHSSGLSFFDNCSPFSNQIRKMVKPLLFANIGVAASQINNALDPLFARYADPEGPAWLWYAIRLQQLPLSLFGIALAGALLPPLSRAAKANDMKNFYRFLEYTLLKTAHFMIPISFAALVLGTSSVNLIFGRGRFLSESVAGTTLCLWGYITGLLPMALILIAAPAFYALNKYHIPTRAAIASVIINISLNTLFIVAFNFSAAGVALATSIAAWVNCGMLFLSFSNKISFKPLIRTFFGSITGAAGVLGIDILYFKNCPSWDLWIGNTPSLPKDAMSQFFVFGIEFAVFALAFTVCAFLLKRKKEEALPDLAM